MFWWIPQFTSEKYWWFDGWSERILRKWSNRACPVLQCIFLWLEQKFNDVGGTNDTSHGWSKSRKVGPAVSKITINHFRGKQSSEVCPFKVDMGGHRPNGSDFQKESSIIFTDSLCYLTTWMHAYTCGLSNRPKIILAFKVSTLWKNDLFVFVALEVSLSFKSTKQKDGASKD